MANLSNQKKFLRLMPQVCKNMYKTKYQIFVKYKVGRPKKVTKSVVVRQARDQTSLNLLFYIVRLNFGIKKHSLTHHIMDGDYNNLVTLLQICHQCLISVQNAAAQAEMLFWHLAGLIDNLATMTLVKRLHP